MSELIKAYSLVADINSRQWLSVGDVIGVLQLYLDYPRSKAVRWGRLIYGWLWTGYRPAGAGSLAVDIEAMRRAADRVVQNKQSHWLPFYDVVRGRVYAVSVPRQSYWGKLPRFRIPDQSEQIISALFCQ